MGYKKQTMLTFTAVELAKFLKWPRTRVVKVARELGILTWSHDKRRITPFTCQQAQAIMAIKHMRSINRNVGVIRKAGNNE